MWAVILIILSLEIEWETEVSANTKLLRNARLDFTPTEIWWFHDWINILQIKKDTKFVSLVSVRRQREPYADIASHIISPPHAICTPHAHRAHSHIHAPCILWPCTCSSMIMLMIWSSCPCSYGYTSTPIFMPMLIPMSVIMITMFILMPMSTCPYAYPWSHDHDHSH